VSATARRVAAVQMQSTAEREANLAVAERLVREAAARGADIVVLPERWNAIGSAELYRSVAEPLPEGPSVQAVRGWARAFDICIVAGSITERQPATERVFNTSFVVDRSGQVGDSYRKLHLFDVEVGGFRYCESDTDDAGNAVVHCDVDGLAVGLTICYDIRFPELYRLLALRGVDVVTVPADFTLHTGKDHWELLLRARAVENGVYVIAAAQHGTRADGRGAYGRSMIVDPWGTVLAQAPDRDGVVIAEVALEHLDTVRRTLPSLQHRRPDMYTGLDAVAAGKRR
jgi:predicted amidohydrolase